MAGNPLETMFSSNFTTAIATGTGDLPTSATISFNPISIFANGKIFTTVMISDIKKSGTPVPNGTLIGITADPAFKHNSVEGVISGASLGSSIDNRFLLFETEDASVSVYYTAPNLDWLLPGVTASGIIQVAAVDLDTRPVNLISNKSVTLFRIKGAEIYADPTALLADGNMQSNVEVTVRDNQDRLVPDRIEVGFSVDNIFADKTASGTILGGKISAMDDRVHIFTTEGGRFTFTFQAPHGFSGPGYTVIQAICVNEQGYAIGLINTTRITLIKVTPP